MPNVDRDPRFSRMMVNLQDGTSVGPVALAGGVMAEVDADGLILSVMLDEGAHVAEELVPVPPVVEPPTLIPEVEPPVIETGPPFDPDEVA